MAKRVKETDTQSEELQEWIGVIAGYEQDFKKWEVKSTKIIKRYRDDNRGPNARARFNILWSNVQTLTAATFANLPKPDVSRRFKDNDPVGRVASTILERCLEYEIQKYTDYGASLRQAIIDRFLGGRGIAWVRYEPHFRAAKSLLPEDGLQISEDIDEPDEELDYECAPCDYVHWKDFGHSKARTWEEVTAVWRVVYLTREQCVERFGEEVGNKIPLDSSPQSKDKEVNTDNRISRAKIYEIWDKVEKKAYWLSKSMNDILDEKDDPLGLDEFFPCPKPLYATLTNDSLEPVPDYALYQDQAEELDIIADRVDGLVKAFKIFGVYDPSVGDLQRLFTEAENTTLIPSANWNKFTEKNGLQGSMQLVDLQPIAIALRELYSAAEQVKGAIYEITGISDIIRGNTQASETATAQQLKGQYASLRLKAYQDEVGRFATELLRIKAQIICGKFSSHTIMAIGALDQLSPEDQQLIPQAMELLIGPERVQNPDSESGHNPLRQFRVDISSDTLVYLDQQEEKQSRMEFVQAMGGFVGQFVNLPPSIAPQIAPLAMEFMKFAVTAFKVGKNIEGKIDQWSDQMVQTLSQPPPQDNSQAQQAQAQQQADMQKHQDEMQARQAEQQHQAQIEANRNQMEAQREAMRLQHEEQLKASDIAFQKWKAELDAATRITIAEISANTAMSKSLMDAETAANQTITKDIQ